MLTGETAVVTGAGRGIGRQIALDLAKAGASVGLISRTASQLDEVAEAIESAGGKALAVAADVTDRKSLEDALKTISDAFGPISIAVNNAGGDRPYGPVEVVNPDDWWHAQELHVKAAYIVMHNVIPQMRARRQGRIINIASSGALVIGANCSSYCVGKATLVRLTEHVHAEIAEAGLSAFVVHPGTIMTDMGLQAIGDPEARKWASGLVDYLSTFENVDTTPTLERVGQQVTALASGYFDALAGRYIDLDVDLEQHIRDMPES